ncbi:hypothetical protein E8E14_013497 [Neopestalotiopsis sp. 37M]|nr:hypothetical protein E8E14_013497 [Neopestalotiopsis sp. 37M]
MDSEKIIEALRKFSSCDVADALAKMKVPGCGLLPGLTLWSPQRQAGDTRIVGPAFTVRYEYLKNDPSTATKATKKKEQSHFVDVAPVGSIILVSTPSTMANACWGGLAAQRAQIRGVAGVVVDGQVRDLDEMRELQYPVFARNISPGPPHEVAYVSEMDQPILINGGTEDCLVKPGDLLVGDLYGVVRLPLDQAEQALEVMQSLSKTELEMMDAIKAGMSMTEASKFRSRNP